MAVHLQPDFNFAFRFISFNSFGIFALFFVHDKYLCDEQAYARLLRFRP